MPLEATARDAGLPAALWQAARLSGTLDALLSVWPAPRHGPSIPHFLLLAAFHRICDPGPKTAVADWYRRSILADLWGFAPSRFSFQAFWDHSDAIDVSDVLDRPQPDELEQARSALLQAFRSRNLVSQRVLAYDTTNFPTRIATTNTRNRLAQRGHDSARDGHAGVGQGQRGAGQHPATAGQRVGCERTLVHGAEYLGVIRHSAGFAAEQCHSVTLSLAKATQKLRALARQIRQPQDRHTEPGLRRRIQRWLRPNLVAQALSYELRRTADGSWDLQFAIEEEAVNRLLTERFGRTTLVTNRLDWSAAQVATAYNGRRHVEVESVFRGLKRGDWLGWGPLYRWTDSKIRVHAFCCPLGVSLL